MAAPVQGKDKPKFIRKNGKVIPVGVDKNGKDKGGTRAAKKKVSGKFVSDTKKIKKTGAKLRKSGRQKKTFGKGLVAGGFLTQVAGFSALGKGKLGALAAVVGGAVGVVGGVAIHKQGRNEERAGKSLGKSARLRNKALRNITKKSTTGF